MIVDYFGDLFIVVFLILLFVGYFWLIYNCYVVCILIKFSLMFKVKIGFVKVFWLNGIGKKCLN